MAAELIFHEDEKELPPARKPTWCKVCGYKHPRNREHVNLRIARPIPEKDPPVGQRTAVAVD